MANSVKHSLRATTVALAACVAYQIHMPTSNAQGFVVRDLSEYVAPNMGTTRGPGNVVIGPQVPWGSINPSPDSIHGNTDGYASGRPLRGFSQTHVTGTGGNGRYGNFLVSPQIGLAVDEDAHDSETTDESASLGYFGVTLSKYNIKAEVTPTHNCAFYRFTFPQSNDANICIDLGHSIAQDILEVPNTGAVAGNITVDAAKGKMSGWATHKGGWGHDFEYTVYFCAVFSKAPTGCGTWKNGTASAGSAESSTKVFQDRIGGYFKFDAAKSEQIYLKIAISMKSVENAEAFLAKEIPAWDFDKVKKDCVSQWNRVLSSILIDDKTATPDQLKLFYTNLYHAMMMPRNRTGDSPWNIKGPYWDDQYCVWDTYRTVFPLHSLLHESVMRDNVNSFIERFNLDGKKNYVADAYVAGVNTYVQGGDDVDPIISDAFAKGIKGVDWAKAYEILKYNADNARTTLYRQNGWVPFDEANVHGTASKTLEFAYNDFCAALVAAGLGKTADRNAYLARSKKWEALWNASKADEGFSGFVDPRKQDMTWMDYDPDARIRDKGFYEGRSWCYSFDLPHHMNRVIELMGGKTAFADRLKYYFDKRKNDWANEPSFLIPWLFNYAGRPDLTPTYVRQGMGRYSLKSPPGNEDSGAMGAWYVFAAIGFFPVAGTDLYLINGPRFKKVTIQMENGASITIAGPDASQPENMYVQSATLNGKPLEQSWFRHGDIKNGATLDFTMGQTASDWAKSGLLPPSFTDIINTPPAPTPPANKPAAGG